MRVENVVDGAVSTAKTMNSQSKGIATVVITKKSAELWSTAPDLIVHAMVLSKVTR